VIKDFQKYDVMMLGMTKTTNFSSFGDMGVHEGPGPVPFSLGKRAQVADYRCLCTCLVSHTWGALGAVQVRCESATLCVGRGLCCQSRKCLWFL